MDAAILDFLINIGGPGIVILWLIRELQAERKSQTEREQIWRKREEMWNEERRQVKEQLFTTVNNNTRIIAQLQFLDKQYGILDKD